MTTQVVEAAARSTLALNEARQRQLAQRTRLGGDSEQQSNLLYTQRRGLESRCAASAAQQARVARLRHNDASRPGQPLYERFVAAWGRVPDKTLKIVFHATKDENIESICRSGLNSRLRGGTHGQAGGSGEYFGREVSVSAPYSQGSRSGCLRDPDGPLGPSLDGSPSQERLSSTRQSTSCRSPSSPLTGRRLRLCSWASWGAQASFGAVVPDSEADRFGARPHARGS